MAWARLLEKRIEDLCIGEPGVKTYQVKCIMRSFQVGFTVGSRSLFSR